jgi:hypothetical protein
MSGKCQVILLTNAGSCKNANKCETVTYNSDIFTGTGEAVSLFSQQICTKILTSGRNINSF